MPLVVHHDGHEPAFDHLHDSEQDHLHDGTGTDSSPLELSDGGSGPRTPPALGRTHAQLVSMLPADPRQAIWPYPSTAKNSNHPSPQAALLPNKKLKKQSLHSHTPTPASGAPPTISTFSASNLNHIHIVQPYVHAQQNDSGSASDSSTTNKPNKQHPQNLCTTSTFSVHPTPAIPSTGQLSFANPYCTNALHTFMPANGAAAGAGGGAGSGGGPGAPAGSASASGQPPRPANAWILYRSDKMKDIAPSLPGQPRPPQADISKLIAAMWKNETPEIRQHYEALSDMKKAEHLALYPGYRFQPMKKADREKVRAEKRAEKEREKMAAIALKNYARKPKPKRGATEDSVGDVTSPTVPQPMAALPWQVQVTGQAAAAAASSSPTTVTSPTSSRGHAFSYQPYASPSAAVSAAAPVKRKRAKTKVEIQTPAIPPEESQQSEYIADAPSQYYDPGAMDYLSYHHPAAHYDNNASQHSSTATSTDPNSLHTPPFDTADPNNQQLHHPDATAIPITLEPVSGQQEIFQLNNFDLSNLGTSFDITLPDNFSLDMAGIGDGMVFEGFEGFGDFVNLDSFGSAASGPGLLDGIEGLEGLGVNMGMGDANSLSLQPGYPNSFGSADAPGQTPSTGNHHQHPQGLTISTQALHSHSHNHSYSMSESVTSPVVETPLSAGSHFGSFQIQHQHQQHVYGASFPSQAQFMSPQGFQSLLSPTQSHFASPPPMSVIDESGTPSNDAYAPRGDRRVAAKWR